MYRSCHSRYAPTSDSAQVVSIDLKTYAGILASVDTEQTRNRTYCFGQDNRRASMEQPKWLMSALVYRHARCKRIIIVSFKADIHTLAYSVSQAFVQSSKVRLSKPDTHSRHSKQAIEATLEARANIAILFC
jgi:hypothetical protein